jgi:Tfp pilus assembly protein PilN
VPPRPAGTRPKGARPAGARPRARSSRTPFILLLVGLLGGALVCLLVISTTLAEGSYRITGLQQQNANLAKQESTLTQQVAQASSPAQIAQEAEEFGMRPNPALQFINLKTGKVVKGQVSKADAEINVPGYNP